MISEKAKLAAVLALAAALRLAGVNYGLPEIYHQDEPIMVNHALAIGASGGNPHFFIIGSFGLYALFFLYAGYFLVGRLTGVFPDLDAFAAAFFSNPAPFYLSGRILLGAAFGTATVWLVWRIARKRFSPRTAFWAALFMAVLPMHVQHSHYIYADIPLTFVLLWLLEALLDLAERPGWARYVRAGALGGWAMSIKYTTAYFLPAALAAHVWAHGRASFSGPALRLLLRGILSSLAVFALFSPFAFLAWPEFYSQVTAQTGSEAHVGWAHHFAYSVWHGSGRIFLAFALAGLFMLGRYERRIAGIWGTAIAVYYAVNSVFGQPFARYMLPLTPVLALAAGVAADRLLVKGRMVRQVHIFLFAAALEMLFMSAYADTLFMKPDTRALAREWVEKNVPDGAAVAVDNRFFAPHLRPTDAQLKQKYEWLGDAPKDAVRKKRLDLQLRAASSGPAYAVYVLRPAESFSERPKFLFDGPFASADRQGLEKAGAQVLILNHTDGMARNAALKQGLEPAVTFSPYRDKGRKASLDPHDSTAAPHMPDELLSRERLGPYLEIYRLK